MISDIERGKTTDAFAQLRLRGVKHKIIALFLRDAAVVLGVSDKDWNEDQHLACQPVDFWVRELACALFGTQRARMRGGRNRFHQDSRDYQLAIKIIRGSLESGVSPLKVNQGIWFACHCVFGDRQRLLTLVKQNDPRTLSNELELVQGFLPHDRPSQLLKRTLANVEQLPRQKQDEVARWLMAEIADEALWEGQFTDSQDVLEQLANEARNDFGAGRTKPLDPDSL